MEAHEIIDGYCYNEEDPLIIEILCILKHSVKKTMGNCTGSIHKNSVFPLNIVPEHTEIFHLMKRCTNNAKIAQIYDDYSDDLESLINAIANNPSSWLDSEGNFDGLFLRTIGVIGNEIGELFYPELEHVLHEWYEHGEVQCPADCKSNICRGHYKTGYIVELRGILADPVCISRKINTVDEIELDKINRRKAKLNDEFEDILTDPPQEPQKLGQC